MSDLLLLGRATIEESLLLLNWLARVGGSRAAWSGVAGRQRQGGFVAAVGAVWVVAGSKGWAPAAQLVLVGAGGVERRLAAGRDTLVGAGCCCCCSRDGGGGWLGWWVLPLA